MNILVTGGTGFVGSHLAQSLNFPGEKNRVVVLMRDLHTGAWGSWLAQALYGCTVVQGDVLDEKLLRRIITDYQIEQVYHLACQAIVSAALKNPISTFEINAVGTANLLEVCRQAKDDMQILVASTDKVYGDNKMNAKETAPLGTTIGIYESSKAAQDIIAQSYMTTYGLNVKISRAGNIYGYDLSPRIIPNTIKSCLQSKPPVIFEGQEDTVRQYVFVTDVVNALKLIMTKQRGIFNIGTPDILTQEEVVLKISDYFHLAPKYVKREPIREIQQQSVNWDLLTAAGWAPKFTFDQGLKWTVEAFKKYGF